MNRTVPSLLLLTISLAARAALDAALDAIESGDYEAGIQLLEADARRTDRTRGNLSRVGGDVVFWKPACSFCGRGAEEVAKLVAGRRMHICDRRVVVAQQIMKAGDGSPDTTTAATTSRS